MYQLYPHQEEMIYHLRDGFRQGHRRQILGAATGCGKTVIASHLASSAKAKGKKILFIVPLIALTQQAKATFEKMGMSVGILQGENTWFSRDDDIIVASIQSIAARTAPDWVDVIIIDECHIEHEAHRKLMDNWNNLPVIGLSATPLRKGLGKRYSNLVKGPSLADLTANKFLAPVRAYIPSIKNVSAALQGVSVGNTTMGKDYRQGELSEAMNSKTLVGDIVKTWKRLGDNRQTLGYACSIAHSQSVVEEFNAEGINAEHVGADNPEEAKDAIERFRSGETKILFSVYKLAVGFDVPDAGCLILARPTKSEMLAVQTIGRGLRPAPGKNDCIILDHANLLLEHFDGGIVESFELPDTLDDIEEKKAKADKKKIKPTMCNGCGKVLEKDEDPCSACGEARPKRTTEVTNEDADLIALNDNESPAAGIPPRPVLKEWYLGWVYHWHIERHKPLEKAYGIAFYRMQEKFGIKAPWAWRSLALKPPSEEQRRYFKHEYIKWKKGRGRRFKAA